jgi:hypothetical protein
VKRNNEGHRIDYSVEFENGDIVNYIIEGTLQKVEEKEDENN